MGIVSPSPDTSNIDSNDSGQTGRLSFGTSLAKSGYQNVGSIGNSSSVNVNNIYGTSSFSNNSRRGIFDGTVVIDGEINETTSA